MKRLLFALTIALYLGVPAAGGLDLVPPAYADNCVATLNLNETARSFISRCRQGKINREFPSEFFDKTLGEIRKGSSDRHKTAWKLLNDRRFLK